MMTQPPVSLRLYWSRRLVTPALFLAALLTVALTGVVAQISSFLQKEALESASLTLAHVLADPILLGEQLEILKRVSFVARSQGLTVSVHDAHGAVVLNYPTGREVSDENSAVSVPIRNAAGVQIGRILARSSHRPPILMVIVVAGILSLAFLFCSAYWLLRSAKPILTDIFSIKLESSEANASRSHSFRFLEVAEVQNALHCQASKLVEFERQKSRFLLARQVAHDIRSPLSAISIVADVADGMAANHRDLLRAAVTQIEKISFDILEQGADQKCVSVPRADSLESHNVQSAISILREVVCIKRLEFCRNKGVTIEESLSVTNGATQLRFEPPKLMRVLSNLVNNAVEALSAAGGRVFAQLTQRDNEIILTIEDNGRGMSRDVHEAALISGGTFGKENGHGFGLSNAKDVVESWGGYLKIETAVGVGTQVSLYLPVKS